jgi:hypothetical protein
MKFNICFLVFFFIEFQRTSPHSLAQSSSKLTLRFFFSSLTLGDALVDGEAAAAAAAEEEEDEEEDLAAEAGLDLAGDLRLPPRLYLSTTLAA